MSSKRVISCVIPARLDSKRLPRKVLQPLAGKPLIQWVYEAACKVALFDSIILAVDCEEIAEVARSFGAEVILTSPDCQSGTDRLVELHQRKLLKGDIIVNWQGDEPFISPEMIEDLLRGENHADVWTLKKKLTDPEQIASPHVTKVVCDREGFALYFSRATIPHYRDPIQQPEIYKHIGLYAYTTQALGKIVSMPLCPLEEAEKLEQLRFLYNGLKIFVQETQHEAFGIDLPQHLVLAEKKFLT